MGKTKKRKCMNTVFDKLSDDDKKVVAEIWNNAKELARNINECCNKLINKSR
mgnify:CR=1 FL=1